MSLIVNPKGSKEFTLKLRIPEWVQERPVPTDLYTYTVPAKPYTVKVNGETVETASLDKGYLNIHRKWKKGDKVELNLPMELRTIRANDNAVDDRGKLAYERGPVIFCLEGQDQPDKSVFDKYIQENTPIKAEYDADLLGGVVTLTGKAKAVMLNGDIKETTFKAIPYSTWNNRGRDNMAIWIPQSPVYTRPTPAPTIASRAQSVTIQAPIQKDAPESASIEEETFGVNDHWEPKSSSDVSKPYHYWWLKTGTMETISYKFDELTEVHNVQVYWLDYDHYDGNFRVPESWKLYYKDGEQWKEVETTDHYGVAKDRYNSVDFKPVKTTALKISAQLQKGESGGVIEWKVN